MTPETRAQLCPLFLALSEALAAAGSPRLAAWARLHHVLLEARDPDDPGWDWEVIVPLAWESRASWVPDPEVLHYTISTFGPPSLFEVTGNLWLLPDGPERQAVIAVLEQLAAVTGDQVPAPLAPPCADLLRAVESLEQTLFDAGQQEGAGVCRTFRRMVTRQWLQCWVLGDAFEFWLCHVGRSTRGWDWLCSADASGLADHVRSNLREGTEASREAIEAALTQVLTVAGLPADATGEARHQARRDAFARLAGLATKSTKRAQELIVAMQRTLSGDGWGARQSLCSGRTATRVQNLVDRAHVELGDLPWLCERLNPLIHGREARAALRALAASS